MSTGRCPQTMAGFTTTYFPNVTSVRRLVVNLRGKCMSYHNIKVQRLKREGETAIRVCLFKMGGQYCCHDVTQHKALQVPKARSGVRLALSTKEFEKYFQDSWRSRAAFKLTPGGALRHSPNASTQQCCRSAEIRHQSGRLRHNMEMTSSAEIFPVMTIFPYQSMMSIVSCCRMDK